MKKIRFLKSHYNKKNYLRPTPIHILMKKCYQIFFAFNKYTSVINLKKISLLHLFAGNESWL